MKSEDHAETQEKKADYFIPKGARWLQDGGKDVPDELGSYTGCLTFRHVFIVTKGADSGCGAVARGRVPAD
jgi:hypothetical protein